MGPDGAFDVPKTGFLVFGKKVLAFLGGCNGARHVPKTGFLVFGKKVLAFLGDGAWWSQRNKIKYNAVCINDIEHGDKETTPTQCNH